MEEDGGQRMEEDGRGQETGDRGGQRRPEEVRGGQRRPEGPEEARGREQKKQKITIHGIVPFSIISLSFCAHISEIPGPRAKIDFVPKVVHELPKKWGHGFFRSCAVRKPLLGGRLTFFGVENSDFHLGDELFRSLESGHRKPKNRKYYKPSALPPASGLPPPPFRPSALPPFCPSALPSFRPFALSPFDIPEKSKKKTNNQTKRIFTRPTQNYLQKIQINSNKNNNQAKET
jgi:hypothetical protein